MELLFDNVRKHTISLPAQTEGGQPAKLQDLIFYIRDKMMTEKKDLFVDGDTVYVVGYYEYGNDKRWLIVLFFSLLGVPVSLCLSTMSIGNSAMSSNMNSRTRMKLSLSALFMVDRYVYIWMLL